MLRVWTQPCILRAMLATLEVDVMSTSMQSIWIEGLRAFTRFSTSSNSRDEDGRPPRVEFGAEADV